MNDAAEELRSTLAPWLAGLNRHELIVQIGACIGGTPPHDEIDLVFRPLLEQGSPAVLVEPQKKEMKRCVAFYREACQPEALARIRFVEAALSDHDGMVNFTVRGRAATTRALSTLRMDRGFAWEDEKNFRVNRILGITLRTLMKNAPPHRGWGWLQVDIEGHEIVVLRQLGGETERPRLLTFEHLHMAAEEKAEAKELLAVLGYREIGWHTDDAAFVNGHGDKSSR